MDSGFVSDWLQAALRLGSPIALVAIGGVYVERSGVYNLGIEGMMLTGAFSAVAVSYFFSAPGLGVVVGMICGAGLAIILAYMAVNRGVDQILTGVAINLLALGLTTVLFRSFIEDSYTRVEGLPHLRVPYLSDIPYVGSLLFSQSVAFYLLLLLAPLGSWVLYRTTFGLNVRAAGEYPEAVSAAGVSVSWVRWACVMIGGLMAGLGGSMLSLGDARMFAENMTAGRGFVALAAIVIGRWNPAMAAAACLVFGLADALQLRVQSLGLAIPPAFIVMLPYVVTVAALIIGGRSRYPAAMCVPYTPNRTEGE